MESNLIRHMAGLPNMGQQKFLASSATGSDRRWLSGTNEANFGSAELSPNADCLAKERSQI
jgi:hypothetical protein